MTGWRARWRAFRDGRLADPGFRRWATAFPLSRPFARRETRALFDIVAGAVYAQVLFACVELNLFALLAAGPQTADALAERLSLPPDSAARLLDAAASLRLLEAREGGLFGLGPLGAVMAGSPGLVAMVRHHAMLYADLADPVALLRGTGGATRLSAYWSYAAADNPERAPAESVEPYTALMAASQDFVAEEVLAAYRFGRHRRLMDVGGGSGRFLAAVAARHPRLGLTLFELPAVAALAGAQLAAAGLADRVTVAAGDAFAESLPDGADLVSFVRVLHDHDDARALDLLRAARRALPAGGTVLIAEPMAGRATGPAGAAYFGFYLLAMGSGRPRHHAELKRMLEAAGFDRVRRWPTATPLLVSVITAQVSASVSLC